MVTPDSAPAAPATATIEVSNISKSYGPLPALRSINLKISKGTTTVLIGPSGCGKSTLIRLMIGLLRPDTGAILFEGSEVRPERVLELRRRMGYVIQEGGLFPHLTVRANVTLMARYLKWERKRIEQRLQELALLAHFPTGGLDRYPAQLSGGERQRVSLMRALLLDPDVLLLDEPLGALDPMIRADLQTDLKKIFHTLAKTVVMVTHDMGEAVFLADVIVLLNQGGIVQAGPPAELLHNPADPFVKSFINAQRLPWLALHDA